MTAATAVLLVGIAAAGCGPTGSTSATGPVSPPPANTQPANTQPANTQPANTQPANTQPANTQPANTQPVNNAYPYRPGGITQSGDEGGVYTFSIPAGAYSLNRQASYNAALDPDGSGTCIFGGELDYVSGGGSIPLGDGGVPVTADVPLDGPPSEGNYAAGDYKLYIYPETTCSWTIMLWP